MVDSWDLSGMNTLQYHTPADMLVSGKGARSISSSAAAANNSHTAGGAATQVRLQQQQLHLINNSSNNTDNCNGYISNHYQGKLAQLTV